MNAIKQNYLVSDRSQGQCTKNNGVINPVEPVTPSTTLHYNIIQQGWIKYCSRYHDLTRFICNRYTSSHN